MQENKDLILAEQCVKPGASSLININIGRLPTGTLIDMPVYVFNGEKPGPVLLVQAGLHGDEINGVEIVRRLIHQNKIRPNAGAIIAVPTVNVYGFIHFSRDMPDGKDINRSFPGSVKGSLASRVARSVCKELVPHIDMAIDLHTGGAQRHNYPQCRYSANDASSKEMATIFDASFNFQSNLIPKSFRKTALEMGISTIVYEGGESMRFNEEVIQVGMQGVLNIMSHYKMISSKANFIKKGQELTSHKWIRSPFAGMFLPQIANGAAFKENQTIGIVTDTYSKQYKEIIANTEGFIICINNKAVVNQGDALFHVGSL